jgi:hypothetical protein
MSTTKRRAKAHAQLHLPELTGHEALLMAGILDRISSALWRAHGEQMCACLCAGATPSEPVTELTEEDRAFYNELV